MNKELPQDKLSSILDEAIFKLAEARGYVMFSELREKIQEVQNELSKAKLMVKDILVPQ